jgi:hypothetical protein
MPRVTLELPEEVFSALRRSPEEFARDLRLAAAVHWYELERSPRKRLPVSQVWTGLTFSLRWPVRGRTPLSWTSTI